MWRREATRRNRRIWFVEYVWRSGVYIYAAKVEEEHHRHQTANGWAWVTDCERPDRKLQVPAECIANEERRIWKRMWEHDMDSNANHSVWRNTSLPQVMRRLTGCRVSIHIHPQIRCMIIFKEEENIQIRILWTWIQCDFL